MRISPIFMSAACALTLVACEDDATSTPTPPTGQLQAALAFMGDTHDVAAMQYVVVGGDNDCDGVALAEATEPLEAEALPPWLTDGDQHAFADALFVLQPGTYRVCVTPITADGEPSAICAPVDGVFEVLAEQTTEGVLYSQCLGDPSGGLDVIAALNDPPHIDDLIINSGKFTTTCETETITVIASDPNGDPLSYAFEVTGAPEGAAVTLEWEGNVATFGADTVGPYEITVTVSDGLGGEATLSFPMHVSECLVELVGSFLVGDGPVWFTPDPPTQAVSCLMACAQLFGGDPADYACSTVEGEINNRAFVDGWGDTSLCDGDGAAEDFVLPEGGGDYDCGVMSCSFSAYVRDHAACFDSRNYCWQIGGF